MHADDTDRDGSPRPATGGLVGSGAQVSGIPVTNTVAVCEIVYATTTVDAGCLAASPHAQSGRRARGHTRSGVGAARARVTVTVAVVGQAGLRPGTVAVTVATVTVVGRGMVTAGTTAVVAMASAFSTIGTPARFRHTIPQAGFGRGRMGKGGQVFAGGSAMTVCV